MTDQVRAEPTEVDLATLKEAVELLKQHPLEFATSPDLADLMAKQLGAWIWMGDFHVDHLDRACWPETIRLAEEIVNIGKGLK